MQLYCEQICSFLIIVTDNFGRNFRKKIGIYKIMYYEFTVISKYIANNVEDLFFKMFIFTMLRELKKNDN